MLCSRLMILVRWGLFYASRRINVIGGASKLGLEYNGTDRALQALCPCVLIDTQVCLSLITIARLAFASRQLWAWVTRGNLRYFITARLTTMSDHHHGATSRQHLHSLMARRATPSVRLPSGTRISTIINPAAELDESFTAQPEIVVGELKMTDFNINLSMSDEFTGIEMSNIIDPNSSITSDVVHDILNDFIRAGVRTNMIAPGPQCEPVNLVHSNGTDGTIPVQEDGNEFLMPSGQLILELNAPVQAADGTEPLDPLQSISKGVNQDYQRVLEEAKETTAQLMAQVTEIRLTETIEHEILPVFNDKIQRLVQECNARVSAAQVTARDFAMRAIEAAEVRSIADATEIDESEREIETNYLTSMEELSSLAALMHKFEQALTTLSDRQYSLQESQLTECTITEIDDAADEKAEKLSQQIETIGERIKLVKQSIENVTGRIRTVLTLRCNIPEKVRAEFAITTIKEKLPEKLNGKPDPLVAEELISFINKLISTYPEQLWSIVPTLHRLINIDHTESAKGERWTPPKLETKYEEVPYDLQPYYASHNQRLFDILVIMGSQAVQRSMSSFSTGDDDFSLRRTSHADHADGVSVLAWHLHYHEQSGYQIRAELQNYLNYAHGAFVDKDPVEAVKTIRKKLREAERLGIKLEYDMSIRRIVEVIRRRDVSFIAPMQRWITCPDQSKSNDCISYMDPLLAEIERIARNVSDVMPNLTDKHHKQAAALFTQFSSAVADEQQSQPQQRKNGETKEWTCPAKGCKHVFSKKQKEQHLEKIKKAKANKGRRVAQLLCDHHLAELKNSGSLEYENGFVRNWHERKPKGASANVAETTNKKSNDKKTEAAESEMEDAIKKAVDDHLAKVTSELGSMIQDAEAEPEPEPAPAQESFASMLAKAIANRK